MRAHAGGCPSSKEFARRSSGREIPVFENIRWVLAKPHWTVHVTKRPQGKIALSIVYWTPREILHFLFK